MKTQRVWITAGLWSLLVLLAGCGGGTPPAVRETPQPADLAGNWLLAGALPAEATAQNVPSVAITFDVNENAITAAGQFEFPCTTTGGRTGFGYGNVLTGTVASDGTFSLSSPKLSGAIDIPSLVVTGTVPAGPGEPWKGTYTVSGGSLTLNGSTQLCTIADTGSFTATALGDLTGTYTGSGTAPFFAGQGTQSTPQTLSLTLHLTQGGPLYGLGTTLAASSRLAVDGSITVQGISCFSHGTSSMDAESLAQGSILNTAFTMDDGSRVMLTEALLQQDASQISLVGLTVAGGKCDGAYALGLTPFLLHR